MKLTTLALLDNAAFTTPFIALFIVGLLYQFGFRNGLWLAIIYLVMAASGYIVATLIHRKIKREIRRLNRVD